MTDNAGYPEEFPLNGAFVIRDIQRKPWWPYRPIEGIVDALWLLGDDSLPEGLFGRLMAEWGEALDWFVAGETYYQVDREPVSWTSNNDVPTAKLLGKLNYQPRHDVFPFYRSMEWWQITPNATDLHSLLQGPLLHPRTGWWLAASTDSDAGPRFMKATTGLLWWGTRDYLPYQGRTHEVVDESVIEALLCLLPQIGLMSVVPLNNHPVSGVAIFGTPDAIQKASTSIGGLPESQGDEILKFAEYGGWLATL